MIDDEVKGIRTLGGLALTTISETVFYIKTEVLALRDKSFVAARWAGSAQKAGSNLNKGDRSSGKRSILAIYLY